MAARVFNQQSTPPAFTCSLQASFLRNVVQEYKRACRRQISRHASDQDYCTSPYEQAIPVPTISENTGPDNAIENDTTRGLERPPLSLDGSRFQETNLYAQGGESLSTHHSAPLTGTGEHNAQGSIVHITSIPSSLVAEESSPNWEFTDEDWTSLFMNAGFDIADGVFIPV